MIDISITHGPSEEDVMYILTRLRACDRHEIVSVGCTVEDAAKLCALSDDCYLMKLKGEPVFVWGSVPSFKHIRKLYGFGTDKTARVIPATTRVINRRWKQFQFRDNGILRVEVRVPVSCTHSLKWLSKLGMQPECTVKHAGILGESYVQLAYTKDDFDVHFGHNG